MVDRRIYYIAFILFSFVGMMMIQALNSENIDEICEDDNSTLIRINGTWTCGNLKDVVFTNITNITNIYNNYSTFSNNSNLLNGFPSSYFYPFYNPLNFYNSTTLDFSNICYSNGTNCNATYNVLNSTGLIKNWTTNLSGYVPYTGATGNVDLNGKNLNNASWFNSTKGLQLGKSFATTRIVTANSRVTLVNAGAKAIRINTSISLLPHEPSTGGTSFINHFEYGYQITFINGTLANKTFIIPTLVPSGSFTQITFNDEYPYPSGVAIGDLVNITQVYLSVYSNNSIMNDLVVLGRTSLYPRVIISGTPSAISTQPNYIILSQLTGTINSSFNAANYGVYGDINEVNNSRDLASYYGVFGEASIGSGNQNINTLNGVGASVNFVNTSYTGNIRQANSIEASIQFSGNQNVTNLSAFRFNYQTGNATVSNMYGLYLSDVIKGTLSNYGIYTGTGINSFGDDILLRNDNDKFIFGTGQDASIYYDGTNLIINSSEVGTGLSYFSGNISARGYITRTEVNNKSNVLEEFKDGNQLINPDGSINHKSFGDCYIPQVVTDFSRPVNITIIDEQCTEKENELNEIVKECENITNIITTYPYKTIEDGVDMTCQQAKQTQALALLNNVINIIDNTTLDAKTIQVTEIFTKSKVPLITGNYFNMFNSSIYNKTTHYAYNSTKNTLNGETRWVGSEGYLACDRKCVLSSNKWEDYKACKISC